MTILKSRVLVCCVLVCSLLAMQGCAVSKDNSRFDHLVNEVNAKATINPEAVLKGISENSFRDIKMLEVETVIRMALDNNPGLTSMRERVKEAAHRYPLVTSLYDPVVGVGFFPSTVVSDRADFAYKIDFRQRILYPGKLGLKGEKAIAEAEVVLNNFSSVKLKLVSMVKTAYLELFFIHRAIEINDENKNLLQEFKTVAESRYSSGAGNLQDVIQADVDLAKAKHRDIVFERELRVATARLNTLMGREAGLPLPASLAALPVMPPLSDKQKLLEKALLNNPSIKAARSKITAASASFKLAEVQSYPDFTFIGSYNRAWMTDELRPFIGMSINIPIRSARLKAEKKIASARLKQVSSDLKAVENQIRFEVEDAWQRLNEFHHSEKLFREVLIPEVKLSLSAARAGYSDGTNDFLTLVSAKRVLVNVKLQYERLHIDLRIRSALLSRVVGQANEK